MPRLAGLALLLGLAAAPAAGAAASLHVTAIYEARLGLKVADLRTDQVVSPGDYKAGARLTSIGALGAIKPATVLAQADGGMAGGAPQPTVYLQTEKNKRRSVRYAPHAPTDPLSVLLRAALQPAGASPCLGTAPVYDGRQRYDLAFSPAGGAAPARFGLLRPTACRLGFRPIAGFSAGPAKKNPFVRGDAVASFAFEPRANVWVMTDVALPTLIRTGHIALTSLHIDGVRPAFAPVPAAAAPKPPAARRRR